MRRRRHVVKFSPVHRVNLFRCVTIVVDGRRAGRLVWSELKQAWVCRGIDGRPPLTDESWSRVELADAKASIRAGIAAFMKGVELAEETPRLRQEGANRDAARDRD